MKKMLLFLISILISLQAFTQVDVQIGTGTTNYYDPLPGWYGWNRSAYLYKATEINTAGIINSVAFEIQEASTGTTTKLKIYLLETSMTAMPGITATNWNALKTGATLVYTNNSFAGSPVGWKTIPLDLVFAYAGVNNLLVLIEGEGCSTSGGCASQCFNHVSPASHWYSRTDTSAPNDNAGSTSSTGYEGTRANIKFNISPSGDFCYPPSQLTASNITTSSADFTWTTHATGSSWVVQYKPTASTQWSADDYTSSGSYSLQGLSATTSYDIRVKSICATNESGWNTISFMTACGAVTQFPWTEGFESSTWPAAVAPGNATAPNCWLNFNTGTATGLWRSTTTAAYVRSGTASAQQYSGGTTSANNDWLISPTFTLTGNERLSFWTKGYSTYVDYIKVAIYDVTQNGHDISSMADTALFTTIMPNTLLDLTNWVKHTIYLNDYVGDFRFAFIRDILGYYINLDDITIETIPLCPEPLSTSVVLGQTSTTINWVPADLSQNSFYLYSKLSTASVYDSVLVSGTSYMLQNLTEGSTYNYYVKADCGTELSNPTAVKTFKTLCSVITTLPASESFDTYGTTTTSYPTCWMRNSTNPASPYISSTNFSAPGSLYFYVGYANGYSIAISPMIDASIPINTLKASLKMRASGLDDTLYIGVMTDPYDISTFEQVGFMVASVITTYQDKEVFFTNYTGSGQFIAIKAAFAATSSTIYVDNVVLDLIPSCPNPTNLSVSNVTGTQLDLSWIENGSASSWDIEYGAPGFTLGSGTQLFSVTDNPYLIDGLTPQTAYQFYVKAVCGAGDESGWSSPLTITTACDAVTTFPYTENFDTYGTTAGTFPNCWFRPVLNTTTPFPSLVTGTTYVVSAPASLKFQSASATAPTYAITPQLDADINTLLVSFQLKAESITSSGTMHVGVMSDPSVPSTFELVQIITPTTTNFTNYEISFANTTLTGAGNYIAFKHVTSSSAYYYWLDDVVVDLIPSCPKPTGLTRIAYTYNSMELDWSDTADANTAGWIVEYKPYDDLVWLSEYTTSHPFTISNLVSNVVYRIRVKAVCLEGDTTNTSDIVNYGLPCEPISVFPWEEGFEGVWFVGNGFGATTDSRPWCWYNINGGASTTYKWQRSTTAAYVRTGLGSLQMYAAATTAQLGDWMITPAFTFSGNERIRFWAKGYSTYTDVLSVKIFDVSTNGIVNAEADTTLFVEIMPNTTIPATTWTQYEIDLSQFVGDYQIAFVRNTTGGYYLNIDDIIIDPIPTCPNPTLLTASDITTNSVDLSWTPGGTETSWNIEYKLSTESTWTLESYVTNPHTIYSLLPSSTYQFRVQADCSGGDLSLFSDPISVVTLCEPITQLPWSDGFESITAAATLPACWAATSFTSKTNTQITNYDSYNRNARTGTRAAYFVWGCNDRFFTPAFDLQAGVSYQFSFWYVTDGLGGWTTLQSGVYSAQNATSLINTITTINLPTNTTYQEVVSYFTPTTDGVYYFGLYCMSTSSPYYLTIDDISLDLAPDCLPVQNLAVTNVVGTSAYVSWLPAGTPDSYTVEISETGSGIWTPYTTNDPFYVLTGLSELTSYSVQVYPNCSGIDGPSDTVNFVTVCASGGDLIIGTPAATTSTNGGYFPTQTFYNYSYTQQIYDATELGTIDTIKSIKFQYFYATPITRNLTIYLGHTTQSTFTAVTNYIPFSSLQQVYQGSVTFNNSGIDNWFNITFPVGFNYDGVSNLVLVVRDMTGTYEISADKFRTHAVTGSKAIYFYQDASAINTTTPSATTSGVSSYRNNVKFSLPCESVTCYQPNVIVTATTSSSASMMIVPGGSETSWEAEYKASTETAWTSLGTVSTATYDLLGLSSNTTYSVRFRTVCSASDMSTWKTVTLTTQCGSISLLPIIQNFDTYGTGTGTYPTCWSTLSSSSSYPYISTTNFSPPSSFYFYVGTASDYNYLITPIIDPSISINTLKAELKLRVSALDDTLYVGVMSNPNDVTSFVLVGKLVPSAITVWQDMDVFFNNYSGTGKYIAFKAKYSTTSTTMYMDNLKIDLIPSCPRPTQLVASAITQNSAILSWTENGTATTWNIEYGPLGFTQGTGTTIYGVSNNSYPLSSLLPSTSYQFYVQAVCGAGDESLWSNVGTFMTSCGSIATLPWTDYFDSYGTGSTIFPPCWTRNTTYADRPYVNTGGVSGVGLLYFYAGTAGTYNIAATPMFDVSIPINTLKAEFKYKNSSSTDTLYVGVMTDPNVASTFVQIAAVGGTSSWQDKEVFFNTYTGTGKYIAFKIAYGTTYAYAYMDNLEIFAIPTCPRPTALTASNATTSSVDLSWTPSGTETSWNVEFGPIGFTPGSGTLVAVTTNPFSLVGLTHSSCYDFYVQAVCSPTDLSIWSQKGTFCSSQIPASVPVNIDFETPSGVQFANNTTGNNWFIGSDLANTVNNTTGGQNALFVSNDNGTTNAFTISTAAVVWAYRDIYFTPSLTDYTFSFNWKANGEGTSPYFYDYLSVYIGSPVIPSTSTTHTPPAGSVVLSSALNLQTTWQTATYTLPLADYSGQTKRIFFCWTNDGSGGTQPPAAVDNISITTTGIVSCITPTNLASSAITPTGATVTWTAGASETAWELDYKVTTASTWTTVPVSTTPSHTLAGLIPSTNYSVRVRAICGTSDLSLYTATHTFNTTATPCDVPTNLQVTNITDQSANATWTAGGSETSWNVEYKLVSSANWTSASTTSPSYPIVGLQSASAYHVRVKAICSGTSESAFTASVPFTTLGGTSFTITATSSANGTITPTGAVTVNSGASQTFNFAANTGFIISAVVVDGTPEATQPTSYTFTNVVANHTIHVDFASGIEENELAQLVELFPNPTASTIELRLKSEQLHIKECRIYDMYGKLMSVLPISSETTTLDVTDFAAGVYFVRMESERGIISKKFVKK